MTTPPSPEAGQAGILVLLLTKFGKVQWSTDLATVECVLAALEGDAEDSSDARP